jgi:ribosome-associated protein
MNNSLIDLIAQTLYDKKGFNILALDVRGVATMTDYFIIAEGNVDRHVKALGQVVMDVLAEKGLKPIHLEGERSGDWIVVDYGDLVLHLFVPDLREKYSLETLWHEGKIIDLNLKIHSEG